MKPSSGVTTRLIVWCVFGLGLAAIIGGTILTYKGYNAELLIGGGTSAIAGLIGTLNPAKAQQASEPTPPTTFSASIPSQTLNTTTTNETST